MKKVQVLQGQDIKTNPNRESVMKLQETEKQEREFLKFPERKENYL